MERLEAVRATNLADEIIVEEYEGQKIDDIRRYDVDIFTVGSDWIGKFDYLNEYCKVVYLPRTEGISSSELRSQERKLQLGLVGETKIIKKFFHECNFVNGIEVARICTSNTSLIKDCMNDGVHYTKEYDELLKNVDAVYIVSHPTMHYSQIKKSLEADKHVLCESPIALLQSECIELFELAAKKNLILMDAIKTAYSTAYARLLLLIKGGRIGDVVSIDTTCTSLSDLIDTTDSKLEEKWNSICSWGPSAFLPIFQILGINYRQKSIITKYLDSDKNFDAFTQINFIYDGAVATAKVGKGVKSEGELIISGTKGYVYVPSPWWKTDYFEIRYENSNENRRYFYQLDGEGIRYELVAFSKGIENLKNDSLIQKNTSIAITKIIEDFNNRVDLIEI
jgi:choline-phosphate cytidylyltransferase